MPNFNTHWLAAIKCIESSDKLPEGIKNGYTKYKDETKNYKKNLHRQFMLWSIQKRIKNSHVLKKTDPAATCLWLW